MYKHKYSEFKTLITAKGKHAVNLRMQCASNLNIRGVIKGTICKIV